MKLVPNLTLQQECVDRVIAWMHTCWELTEAGQPVQPDPFYKRASLLTPAVVGNVIREIEALFLSEFKRYPDYHRKAQGISAGEYLVPPAFGALPYEQQLAIVIGIDKVMQEYREPDE